MLSRNRRQALPRYASAALLAPASRGATEHFVFEITGRSSKIEQFISIMTELGLAEVSRTGIAAIARGPKGM